MNTWSELRVLLGRTAYMPDLKFGVDDVSLELRRASALSNMLVILIEIYAIIAIILTSGSQ
jgi:hypothetical protein